ncbi:MAG: arginine--tRNA ligase [Candidatus Daviesbacteria bacterium]|nr:arginine--tRNA ligase [Candidatus Daviesbacteria bacterium]
MLKKKILEDLKKAVKDLGLPAGRQAYHTSDIVCTIPQNPSFGDYTTNVALQLAKQLSVVSYQSSVEIANKIVSNLGHLSYLSNLEVKGGGFINFFIKDEELVKNANDLGILQRSPAPQKILVEYGHVNPLKEIHIGHLRTFFLGESISRILEALGHSVFRANYQGDIGLHIAKAIWGIKKLGLASFLGQAYAEGSRLYEEDAAVGQEIDQINTDLYKKEPAIQKVYQQTRTWSLEYFEPIYELLGVKYDRCFFESEVFERGRQIVEDNIGKVFEKSEGAVIFPGEKYGLHNRVFITKAGNPTYEGKEMGLAELEYDTFNYGKSVHVVASEQEGYFQVVFKAIELTLPYLTNKKYHLSYGVVNLKTGKMSSRTGNVVTVDDLYKVTSEKVREIMKESRSIDQQVVSKVALGAMKFSYLKFSPRPNMVFDLEQSVSLDGDSGPYLQYTNARIQSILKGADLRFDIEYEGLEIDASERAILRQLMYFQETVEQAANMYHPNLLASYLIDLARLYNLFYQENRVIGSPKQDFRLKLSLETAEVLKKGLYLLGIETPERM